MTRSRLDDATTSIRTLGRGRRRLGASLDARTSIELVSRNAEEAATLPAGTNPVTAARRWIASSHPNLPTEIVARADRALDVAERYFLELDALAAVVAEDSNRAGRTPDPVRLSQVDVMTQTVARFSTELRSLLDTSSTDPAATTSRLDAALAAADAPDAGLPAFVVALTARS